ncbi:PspA/IM30 family protein [Bacillus dakarensis]|uniref:PspA/IM30 family protein n=1 Tax=Robertmurraya dakarensis TaxID=1926278 RepID=UPI0009809BC1|nr:PspA/IM30 family protein [Bacillus dakarensis]
MENLFTRIKNTVLADINEVLDRKETQNPIKLLNQYLRQCEQETEKVKKLVERQYSLNEEFSREYNQALNMAEKRKRQAEIALKANENDLYQFAIQEELHYSERAERLKQLLSESGSQLHDLEKKYEEMKHKLKDMQIRRMELMGRENITRANQQISRVTEDETYSNTAYSRFQEIESYLEQLENKVSKSFHRHTIDARIAEIEKNMPKEDLLSK